MNLTFKDMNIVSTVRLISDTRAIGLERFMSESMSLLSDYELLCFYIFISEYCTFKMLEIGIANVDVSSSAPC